MVPDILKGIASLLWPLLIIFLIIFFARQLKQLAIAAVESIPHGGSIEIWKVKLKGVAIKSKRAPVHLLGPAIDVPNADNVRPKPYSTCKASPADFEHRKQLRYASRFVRLVHTVTFAERKDWPYDMSVYVIIEKIPPDYERDRDAIPAHLNEIER